MAVTRRRVLVKRNVRQFPPQRKWYFLRRGFFFPAGPLYCPHTISGGQRLSSRYAHTLTPTRNHPPARIPGRVPLPAPETIAQRLGGRRAGAGWRIPHLCAGESSLGDNPGLALRRAPDGHTTVRCFHANCPLEQDPARVYAVVRRALNLDDAGGYRPPPPVVLAPEPKPQQRRPWVRPHYREPLGAMLIPGEAGTGFPYLSGDSTYKEQLRELAAVRSFTAWVPYLLPDGQRRDKIRRYPADGGAKARWDGDTGRRTSGLVPYLWQDIPDTALVLAEGEQATAAIVSSGAPYSVASVDGAGAWLTADFAPVVAGRTVVVWADADEVGRYTAQRAVDRMLDAGATAVHFVPTAAVQDAARSALGGDRWDALDTALDAPPPDDAVRREQTLALFLAAVADTRGADAADVPPAMVAPLIQAALVSVSPPQPDDDDDAAEPRGLVLPPIPGDMRCRELGRAFLTRWVPDSDRILTPLPCGVCDRCMRWHNRKRRLRYEARARRYGAQTVVTARLESAAAAAKFRRSQGRRCAGLRVSVLRPLDIADGGGVECTVIYAAPLTDADARNTARALVRAGLPHTLDTRRLTGQEMEMMLPNRKTLRDDDQDQDQDDQQDTQPQRYHTVTFSDDWGYPILDQPDDYAGGDGVIVEVPEGEPPLTQEVVPASVAHRRATLDTEACAVLYAGEWLAQMTAPIPRADWDALVAVALDPSGDTRPEIERIRQDTGYAGPSRLLIHTAQWQAHLRPYRAAFEVVVDRIEPLTRAEMQRRMAR